MTKNIVNAMIETYVKRIIAINSIGIYKTLLKSILIQYRKLTDIVEESKLEYTILRPDWSTDVNEIDYIFTQKGEMEIGSNISIISTAKFIASIIENPSLYINKNIGISKP